MNNYLANFEQYIFYKIRLKEFRRKLAQQYYRALSNLKHRTDPTVQKC